MVHPLLDACTSAGLVHFAASAKHARMLPGWVQHAPHALDPHEGPAGFADPRALGRAGEPRDDHGLARKRGGDVAKDNAAGRVDVCGLLLGRAAAEVDGRVGSVDLSGGVLPVARRARHPRVRQLDGPSTRLRHTAHRVRRRRRRNLCCARVASRARRAHDEQLQLPAAVAVRACDFKRGVPDNGDQKPTGVAASMQRQRPLEFARRSQPPRPLAPCRAPLATVRAASCSTLRPQSHAPRLMHAGMFAGSVARPRAQQHRSTISHPLAGGH